MVKKILFETEYGPKEDIRYFGKDAEDFLVEIGWPEDIKFLGKECKTNSEETGIIIGIEDSNRFMDYYYIVYIPETGDVKYELANSMKFVNTIKV